MITLLRVAQIASLRYFFFLLRTVVVVVDDHHFTQGGVGVVCITQSTRNNRDTRTHTRTHLNTHLHDTDETNSGKWSRRAGTIAGERAGAVVWVVASGCKCTPVCAARLARKSTVIVGSGKALGDDDELLLVGVER